MDALIPGKQCGPQKKIVWVSLDLSIAMCEVVVVVDVASVSSEFRGLCVRLSFRFRFPFIF